MAGELLVASGLVVAVTAAVRGIWSPCGLSMISAINPFTERARGNKYLLTCLWFVLGSVAGGAVFGAIGAVLAPAFTGFGGSGSTIAVIAALCCLICAASDAGTFGVKLPLHPRQVNEYWLGRYRRWVYAAGFGAQIGSGFSTYIMTAAVYLTPVLGALTGSPRWAITLGLTFGLVRGLAVLLSVSAREPAGLRRLHSRLATAAPWSLRIVTAVQVVAAAAFGFSAAGLAGVLVVGGLVVGASALHYRRSARPQPVLVD